MKNKKFLTVICATLAISIFTFSGCNGRGVSGKTAVTPPPIKKVTVEKKAEAPVVKKASTAKEEEDFQTTVATSSGLGKKSTLPVVLKSETEYRPIISVGSDPVSGNGTADNEKLDKLGGCFHASIFVDPEIFKGLSQMQEIALREAIADAVKKSGADFLLSPRWELSVSTNKKDTEISCTVSGYPAKVIGFEEVSLVKQEIDSLKKQVSEKDSEIQKLHKELGVLKELVKGKDAVIAALNKKIAIPTRVEMMESYLKLIKTYGLKDMDDIRKILAIMGEGVATSEKLLQSPGIVVKPGDVTLKSNLDVAVPVEIPAVQVKLVD